MRREGDAIGVAMMRQSDSMGSEEWGLPMLVPIPGVKRKHVQVLYGGWRGPLLAGDSVEVGMFPAKFTFDANAAPSFYFSLGANSTGAGPGVPSCYTTAGVGCAVKLTQSGLN
jgi:hypothetical protein